MATNDTRQSDGNTMLGLGKRWLKTQLRVHGNPRKAHHDRREAAAIESEMRNRAEADPGLRVMLDATITLP